MRFQALKRYNKDDYSGAAEWFLTFLDNINTAIDTLNPLLAHNVDIDNNLLAERRTVLVTQATPFKIKMQRLAVQPTLVRVGYAAGYVGIAGITSYNTDGSVSVTVYYTVIPPGPILTTLVFEP
jgi:hypothetical protein